MHMSYNFAFGMITHNFLFSSADFIMIVINLILRLVSKIIKQHIVIRVFLNKLCEPYKVISFSKINFVTNFKTDRNP